MKAEKLIKTISMAGMLCMASVAVAQTSNTDAFGQGSNIINAGVGIGGDYTYISSGYTSTPNIVLSYDNGTFGNVGPGTISLGAIFSYKGVSYDYTDPFTGYYYDQSWTYYILGVRSAYHWNFTSSSKFDPYAGLMLGYYDVSFKTSSSDPYYNNPGNPHYYYYSNNYNSYLALSLYIGARYYLSNRVGLWLELGFGYTDLAFGVAFKL
jgi:hypothetical protein